ncbi:MAG TPA: YchJ family metal-binding protein [Nocardioides sp.]|nr:YchJ family metal-binding protein [Nocardioides sp.]
MTRGACPCGTGRPYADCCGPFHRGAARPATAEELMRSRYSAFVAGAAAYLLETWHPATRPATLDLDDAIRWTGLEVLATEGGGPDERRGVVEFRAHHVMDGEPDVLHEVSRFRRDGEGWRYVRGRTVRSASSAPIGPGNVDTSPHAGRATGSGVPPGVGSGGTENHREEQA